jgi:3-oxoacyl-[acyl-carrier protein] reductase
MELEGKVALITGATRGIGEAILTRLGEEGATVIGTATQPEGVEKIKERMNKIGLKGEGILLNVKDKEAIETALNNIIQSYGAPSILVNNAAITRDNLFLRMKEEEWHEVFETNLNSIFTLTKACIRHMIKAKWGRVISIGSIVGSVGNPGQTNYAATKAALIGFSKSLAHEVASRNITVNIVAPGFVDTDMTRSLTEQQKQSLLGKIPMQRLGQPRDIAAVVSFLASEQAAYITGQTMHVNGGMYMA